MDAILITSPDGSVLQANDAACRILGYSGKELTDIGRAGIVDKDDVRLGEAKRRAGPERTVNQAQDWVCIFARNLLRNITVKYGLKANRE